MDNPLEKCSKNQIFLKNCGGLFLTGCQIPSSHSHFLSLTAWRQNKVEKLVDHGAVTRAAEENLLHHRAFMGCRVVHAQMLGFHPSPSSLGAWRALPHVVPCSLGSVVPCLKPIPPGCCPSPALSGCTAGPAFLPVLLSWAVHTCTQTQTMAKKTTSWGKNTATLYLGVKFKNIHTSQFCLNWLCHCLFQPKAAAKCSDVSAGGPNSLSWGCQLAFPLLQGVAERGCIPLLVLPLGLINLNLVEHKIPRGLAFCLPFSPVSLTSYSHFICDMQDSRTLLCPSWTKTFISNNLPGSP